MFQNMNFKLSFKLFTEISWLQIVLDVLKFDIFYKWNEHVSMHFQLLNLSISIHSFMDLIFINSNKW
jgi:hypothetical protein